MAVSRSLRFQILRRDNNTCTYCGRTPPEVKLAVDHVVPEALGGSDDPSNLTTACEDCNGGKAATPADASKVAAVAEDAQRWAAAQAFVIADITSTIALRADEYARFDRAWREIGSPFRPVNWRHTVDQIRDTGLPMAILIYCVERAGDQARVQEGEKFRYMCGIAWSRIREMREKVTARVRGNEVVPTFAAPTGDDRVSLLTPSERDRIEVPANAAGRLEVADSILEDLSADEFAKYMAAGRQQAIDEGEDPADWVDDGYDRVRAAQAAVWDKHERLFALENAIHMAARGTPADSRERIKAGVRSSMAMGYFTDDDVPSFLAQEMNKEIIHLTLALEAATPDQP